MRLLTVSVRSLLLLLPVPRIRSLALQSSSRTAEALALLHQNILREIIRVPTSAQPNAPRMPDEIPLRALRAVNVEMRQHRVVVRETESLPVTPRAPLADNHGGAPDWATGEQSVKAETRAVVVHA